jgi:hypothetical protein
LPARVPAEATTSGAADGTAAPLVADGPLTVAEKP